jgi:hypothetical protein
MLKACGSEEKLYSDSVFASYTYTGNGSTQTITNGIDLAGKGGLVWTKRRDNAGNNRLYDTERGATSNLISDSTNANSVIADSLTAFTSSGFSLGASSASNFSAGTYVSWTFRRAPKFFDVVTYTGNGVDNREIPHSLGGTCGMAIVKKTSASGTSWKVGTRTGAWLRLNETTADDASAWAGGNVSVNASSFILSAYSGDISHVNANGATYVAYLFAHDTSTDGIIQCGSFTTDGSYTATVSLGWEPQYVMVKQVNATSNWRSVDIMRGMPVDVSTPGNSPGRQCLSPNLANAEYENIGAQPTSTGFIARENTGTYIYLAIRRSNKPPTTGTQVYNAIARTGTGAAATVTGVGFDPDLLIAANRLGIKYALDRLRGRSQSIVTSSTAAEVTSVNATNDLVSFDMNGVTYGANWNISINSSGASYIDWNFKRAVGVFDVVCYTGTGSNRTESHNLGAVPELWLVKSRSGTTGWVFGSSLLANTEYIACPSPNGRVTDATMWNSTYPTSTTLSLGTSSTTNASAATFVAYLWSSLAGISKVFTYTGNGSSQNVDCGFTTGARFVMVIRCTASTAQDVFIWDSTRGIVSGNDPHLSLNTTAAEVTTDDSIDPLNAGFTINQVAATNVNVSGAVYIYLAFA